MHDFYVVQGMGVRCAEKLGERDRDGRRQVQIRIRSVSRPQWVDARLVFTDPGVARTTWHRARDYRDRQDRQGRKLVITEALLEMVGEPAHA